MPQLWCGHDRWWAPHAGRIPGAVFDLPFPCPLDHVFDLENFYAIAQQSQPHSLIVYGPNIEIRESSFLHNHR